MKRKELQKKGNNRKKFKDIRGVKVEKKHSIFTIYEEQFQAILRFCKLIAGLIVGLLVLILIAWGGSLILPYLIILLDGFVKAMVYPLNIILGFIGIVFNVAKDVEQQIYFTIGIILIIISICFSIQFIISRFKAQYLPITKQECEKLGIFSALDYCEFVHKYMYKFALPRYTQGVIGTFLSNTYCYKKDDYSIFNDISFKGVFTIYAGVIGLLFLIGYYVGPIIVLGKCIILGRIIVLAHGFILLFILSAGLFGLIVLSFSNIER